MAKRGGNTEVNGFISFAPDKKSGTTALKKAPTRRRGSVDREDKKKELLKTKKPVRDESLEKHGTPKHRQETRLQRKPDSHTTTRDTDKSKTSKEEKVAPTDKQKIRTTEAQKKSIKTNEEKQQKLKTSKLSTKTASPHHSSTKTRPKNDDAKLKSQPSMKTSKPVKPSTNIRSHESITRKKISSMASSEEFEIASKRSIERIRKLTSSLEEKLVLSPSRNINGRMGANQKEMSKSNRREEMESSNLKTVNRDATTFKHESANSDNEPHVFGMATSSSSTNAGASVEESDSYEDDFESYESDFEECTESGVSGDQDLTSSSDDEDDDISDLYPSLGNAEKPVVEEERKLDSGNYDLSTQKQQHQLNEIKDALLKENSTLTLTRNSINKQEETILSSNEKSNEKIFINFADAKQRQIKQKVNEKVQKRGAILMEMINLDTMMFSLLDMPSVPYDIFIKCYGKSNTQQMQTQTNDDCLSEEVQTEEIHVSNKWTQHPIKFHPIDSNPELFLNRFILDRKGVGDDGMFNETDEEWQANLQVNSIRLQNFLSSASEVVLTLLEEEQSLRKSNGKSVLSAHSKAISDGFTALNFENAEFLKGRQITSLKFSLTTPNQMITVHKESELTPSSLRDECFGRCMICVWNVYKHSTPHKILVSPGNVISAQLQAHLVFAGLNDGSICVWDLREKSAWHQRTGLHGSEHTLRSPTFITTKVLNETSHTSPVVSVECCVNKTKEEAQETSTYQIASLEVDGIIIIWTVVHLILSKYSGENMGNTTVAGLAPWGHVRLVPSVSINVLQFTSRSLIGNVECKVLSVSGNHLFVGTNTGMITHCLKGNSKGQPPCYYSSKEGISEISCIEASPTGDPLFLSASSDGKVNLFQRKIRNPMIELIGTVNDPGPPVKSICWSPVKQNIFFVLDGESSIHVWDLCYSDFSPRFTLPKTESTITAMSISPHAEEPLLALSTDKGGIEIHRLNEALSEDKSKRESEMFKHYLNIVCC
ncbi:cytoplasmic dynein 2 intermediate chain 1 isoform X2 [Nilaparvata lugens]|uniref:cytoplasmic dynein 2 intermediate chain 1 isoform X2 n=1 Tax=Nilaparvata lugens TaxID=108931 RepID=UPI00193C9845|nr:cytoplasmic dynein 2 intermediate chain 1 isoform X2 [Nilaparvata lugens]